MVVYPVTVYPMCVDTVKVSIDMSKWLKYIVLEPSKVFRFPSHPGRVSDNSKIIKILKMNKKIHCTTVKVKIQVHQDVK